MELSGYEKSFDLNLVFAALSDPTRRAILAHLSGGSATVGELAQPFQISQPAVSKHLKVLENAGLIARETHAQTRPARLNAEPMQAAVAWLEGFRDNWDKTFDQLDQLLSELTDKETG